jgi:hypothetical protein
MSDALDWPDLPPDLLFDCVIDQEVAAMPGMIATREVDAVGGAGERQRWVDASPGSPLLPTAVGDVVTGHATSFAARRLKGAPCSRVAHATGSRRPLTGSPDSRSASRITVRSPR